MSLDITAARTLILQRGGLAAQLAASLFDTHIRATGTVEIDKLTVPDNWPDEPIIIGAQGETYALRRELIGIGAAREVRSFAEKLNPNPAS